jgi:hypothetical protein
MTQNQELQKLLDRYSRQLRRVAPAWLHFIGGQPDPMWKPSTKLKEHLSSRFQRLNRCKERTADIGQSCRQITRGIYLARAALEWKSPSVGSGGPTAIIRGEQWRVAMAWAGLETVLKATVSVSKDTGIKCSALERACEFCEDGLPDHLRPPSARLKRLQEARNWPSENGQPAMLDYLGAGKGYAGQVLRRWLFEGKPLKSSIELLGCAQAIRHATAHGALSSSGIRSWGIRPALLPLTVTTAGVTCGLIQTLREDS